MLNQEFNKKMNNNNPWKRVMPRDISNNPYFKENKEEIKPDDTSSEENNPDFNSSMGALTTGVYSFVEDNPYAKTVHKLQNALKNSSNAVHPLFTMSNNSKIYRPLSFKENIEARINDYETKTNPDGVARSDEERTKLFKQYLDSCTGFAYKSKSTKFKINSICEELIIIDKDFNDSFKAVNYSSFKGKEFDSSKGVYNSLLSKSEFTDHEVYRFLYNNDTNLMSAYWTIVHSLKTQDNLMGLWVRQNTDKDELRALYVNYLGNYSSAFGNGNLSNDARFLLVAPQKILHKK